MAELFVYTPPVEHEFPSALFRADDDIPTAQCETATGATTVEAIANAAHGLGKAHTIVGGRIYTDMSIVEMTAFCSVAYAPAS